MKRILSNKGARTGVFFGATSGVITTIGLIAGLNAGTKSVVAVLGGILVVAVADAMSDAMGIHLAQESDPDSTEEHIWAATIWTFLTKLIVALTFAVPLLWFPLQLAVAVSVGWGLLVITVLSAFLARIQNARVLHVVTEHVLIAIIVVAISHFIGVWVNNAFA
jgi:VIT1/CCC1 family predicted Fe2+/Mn2+ transporter